MAPQRGGESESNSWREALVSPVKQGRTSQLQWEVVEHTNFEHSVAPRGRSIRVSRAKIPLGWLVVVDSSGGEEMSAIFVPDPDHKWK